MQRDTWTAYFPSNSLASYNLRSASMMAALCTATARCYVNLPGGTAGIKTGNLPAGWRIQHQAQKPRDSRWESHRPRHTNPAQPLVPSSEPIRLDKIFVGGLSLGRCPGG